MPDEGFDKYWTAQGEFIAQGGQIGASELYAIYDNLDIGHFKPSYLPDEKTVTGKASERKAAIFALAEKLWSWGPENWLNKEAINLVQARIISGSKETGGKDNLDDVVSPEVLIRIVATAKLVAEDDSDREITDEAVRALNVTLSEVCAKGRTRMTMITNRSLYSILRKGGLMIGTGGGKYLPYPEKLLPELLCMLHKDYVNPEAYR